MSISRIDIYTVTAAVVMSTVYDYEPNPQNDHVVSILNNYHRASVAGIALKKILLLKALPFLYVPVVESIQTRLKLSGKVLYIPEWLPGLWIRSEASDAYAWRNKLVETPLRYAGEVLTSNGQSGCTGEHNTTPSILPNEK